jgi:tetratricopeptide (TPR) repeat protein
VTIYGNFQVHEEVIPMMRHFGLAVLALLAAPAAAAQVTVLGGGIARECYEATKFQTISAADAERLCTRALELEAMNSANRAATLTNRGVVRMRQGKLDPALSDYNNAKRIRPQVGATYLNEGAAYILKGEFNSALDSLNRAIELDSDDLYAAFYNRAIAREQTGDVEGAYFDFLKSQELNPDFGLTRRQLERFTLVTN